MASTSPKKAAARSRNSRTPSGTRTTGCYDRRQGRRCLYSRPMAASHVLLERYRHLLARGDERFPITLGEGCTPLVRTRRLGADLGLEELYLKYEGTNPTGSFKDRGMVLAVNRAVAGGAEAVVCASTGNPAASAA